jgi:N-acetylmuramoyl-L-alanine amidase
LAVAVPVAQLVGQSGATYTIVSRDGRRSLPITTVNNQEFVALDDLAQVFQLAIREESGAITISARGRTIILTTGQALASISGRLISLPAAPTRVGGRWAVPIEFISRALSAVHDARLELRRPSRLLLVGDLRAPRLSIRFEPLPNAARITIDATPRATATAVQDGERLTIAYDADLVDAAVPGIAPQPIVQGIRVVDPVTLAVELGPRFAGFRASTQNADDTSRLVIDLVGSADTTAATPGPAAPPPAAAELPVFGQQAAVLRTIALDPGHGGEDAGATGVDGIIEKDLTLAIARRLKIAIETRLGIRVLLTRESDHAVPLDQRTALANNNKADVFISLHANASPREAKTGASIYFAAFPDGIGAPAQATERLPVFGGGSRDLELVPWDQAQSRFVERSSSLAALLEQQFRPRVPLDARPVGRAPFRVLESANMPAVLVEIGYLTNDAQARQLAEPAFQAAVVQAMFDAILKFRDQLSPGEGDK